MGETAMTEGDYSNLEIVFACARKDMAQNEDSVVGLINLSRKIVEKLQTYEKSLLESKDVKKDIVDKLIEKREEQ